MSTMTIDALLDSSDLCDTVVDERPAVALRSTTAGGPQVRLTRRGRLVVFVLSLLLVLVAGVLLAAGGSVATEQAQPTQVVMVASGDTLWGIASALADDGEVPEMMTRIEQLNGLESGSLQAGQQLLVPVD